MKRFIQIITIFSLTLLLAACGSDGKEVHTFKLKENGIVSTLDFQVKGDTIIKQRATNYMDYEETGIFTEEEARSILDPVVEQFRDIPGVTHDITYKRTEAIETLEVDYAQANIEDIAFLSGSTFEGDLDAQRVSLEETQKQLEEIGYVKVK